MEGVNAASHRYHFAAWKAKNKKIFGPKIALKMVILGPLFEVHPPTQITYTFQKFLIKRRKMIRKMGVHFF